MISNRACATLSVALFAAAAAAAEQGAAGPPSGGRLTPEQVAASVTSAMDPAVDPCQDFYRYACGGWLAVTELPADKPRWGRGFSVIQERNQDLLREILEQAAKDSGGDPNRARIGAFYSSCMDEEAAERKKSAPLRPMMRQIAAVQDPASVMQVVGRLHRVAVPVFWAGAVAPDFKNPETNIAHLFQGGLGLPDRDYYLKDDDRSVDLRKEYEAHVAAMLGLLGEDEALARTHAAAILALETDLAKASMDRSETRDPEKIYHPIGLDGLEARTPDLPWEAYLSVIESPKLATLNVGMPEFFVEVQDAITGTAPDSLRAYLRWHLVHGTAALLSRDFVDADFAFFGRKLQGQQELEPRWKRCVAATDEALGEALGQAYVERTFAGDSKEKAVDMIVAIEAAFAGNLPDLAWMDDPTRARALDKMHAITNKIGYPDAWRDYSSLEVKPGDYVGNAMAARLFEFRRNLKKIGQPVDRKEWFMTPPTVNAYYNPLGNEMVFPAGILQSPFFHRDFPAPMNFGGIGMVMGHELTHGFDDSGRKFDGSGQLREWWDPKVAERFEERARCVEDLYGSYEVQPDLRLNGKLTLGENIADMGGVKEAHGAWRAWVKKNGEPPSPVAGLKPDQLFFVGFAQTWCSVAAPEYERMLVTVDSHSPPRFRVNGPLSNLPAFGEAFGCAVGTPMRPQAACEVW
jgi:endothelin-converting enzyme/putative endopeptidase